MNPVWLPIIGLGVLLVVLGALLVLTGSRAVRDTSSLRAAADPCGRILTAWENAKSECEEASRAAEAERATAERRVAEVEAAREVAMQAEARAAEICGRAAKSHRAYKACVKERGSPRRESRSR